MKKQMHAYEKYTCTQTNLFICSVSLRSYSYSDNNEHRHSSSQRWTGALRPPWVRFPQRLSRDLYRCRLPENECDCTMSSDVTGASYQIVHEAIAHCTDVVPASCMCLQTLFGRSKSDEIIFERVTLSLISQSLSRKFSHYSFQDRVAFFVPLQVSF